MCQQHNKNAGKGESKTSSFKSSHPTRFGCIFSMLQKLMQTWDKDVSSLTKVPPYIPFNFLFLHISLWHFRRNRVSKTACKQRNVCCFQSWLPLLCWITCRSLQESCWTDKAWLLHPSVSRTMLPLHWIGKHSRSRFLIVFTVEKKRSESTELHHCLSSLFTFWCSSLTACSQRRYMF